MADTTPSAGPKDGEATSSRVGTAETWIRPGIDIYPTKDSMCTLSFILHSTENDTVYALTAGHCVGNTGQRIYINMTFGDEEDAVAFGQVERFEDQFGTTSSDWALVRVYEEMVPHVSPVVKHWSGPTGVSPAGAIEAKDRVCYYGQGEAERSWSTTSNLTPSKPHRCGSFDGYTDEGEAPDRVRWRLADVLAGDDPIVRGKTEPGDSGGPVIDYETGEALGILTGSENLYWQVATSVYGVMDILEEGGYDLELVTAEYDPPPADWY